MGKLTWKALQLWLLHGAPSGSRRFCRELSVACFGSTLPWKGLHGTDLPLSRYLLPSELHLSLPRGALPNWPPACKNGHRYDCSSVRCPDECFVPDCTFCKHKAQVCFKPLNPQHLCSAQHIVRAEYLINEWTNIREHVWENVTLTKVQSVLVKKASNSTPKIYRCLNCWIGCVLYVQERPTQLILNPP